MPYDHELLRELRRLSRAGLVNDEEFLVLQKILSGERLTADKQRRFERLFVEKSKHRPDLAAPRSRSEDAD